MCQRLNNLVREACEKYTDIPSAKKWTLEQIDEPLREEIIAGAVEMAVKQAIHERRHKNKLMVRSQASRGFDSISAAAPIAAMSILDRYTLRSGEDGQPHVLGDATSRDLEVDATLDESQGNGMLHEALFKRMVAQNLSEGKRVRDCMTGEQAMRLLNIAQSAPPVAITPDSTKTSFICEACANVMTVKGILQPEKCSKCSASAIKPMPSRKKVA